VTYDAVRDVAIQTAIRGGEDAKLFTEIEDVRRESKKSDKKENK
jgi:hypothetical protein